MSHELYQIIDHSTRMKWPKILLHNIMTLRKQQQSGFKQMIKLNWVVDKLQMEAKKTKNHLKHFKIRNTYNK